MLPVSPVSLMFKQSNLDVIFALALKWHFSDSTSFFFQDIPVQSAIELPIFFFDCLLSFLQANSKTQTWNFKKDKHSCPTLPALLLEALSILRSWDVAGICRKHWDFWILVQSCCFDFCVVYRGSDKLWQMNNAHQCSPILYLDLHYQSMCDITSKP